MEAAIIARIPLNVQGADPASSIAAWKGRISLGTTW
jgi:hypothetical protein